MIYLFTLLNILNYLDRYLVASVLPSLKTEFLLNHEQSGELQSAFVIGYVIFAPIFGYFGDRVSRPKLMTFGAVFWSLATIGSGLATSFNMFFLMRILVGVGEASFVTAAPGFIKDRLKVPDKINSALALFFSAIPVGAALGYVLGGTMAANFGWRAAFFVGGLPGLILAFFFLLFKEGDRLHLKEPVSLIRGTREILSHPILVIAIVGYTFQSFALNGIATFIIPFGISIGFEDDKINQYFGIILVLSGFLGTLGGGRIASAWAKRSVNPVRVMLLFIGAITLIAVPLLALCFVTESHALFLGLCFLGELLVFAAMAPVNSILVLASPSHVVTLTQGLTVLILNLFGAFLAPIVIGRAADMAGLSMALQLSSLALLGCAMVWLLGGRWSK